MKFVEKIKKNWKKIAISTGILGCGILGGYIIRKNLEKKDNYNNNYNYNNKHNNKHKNKKK